jgi:hypothetical protein
MQVVNFPPKLQKRMHFGSLVAVRTLGRFLREPKDLAIKDWVSLATVFIRFLKSV